jgi:hypothetical protein
MAAKAAEYKSLYKVAGTNEQGVELRKFNDAAIQTQIDRAVASARLKEDGKTFAIVGYATEVNGHRQVSGALIIRADGPWGTDFSFAGVLTHDFTTGDDRKELGVRIRG